MTRSTLRTLLRRRLNEQTADNWDDNTLNTFLDLAYALVLKQVRKVDPEAVLFWDQRNIVAGTTWYAKPAGTRGPVEVAMKSTAADTDWTPLPRRPYHIARDITSVDDTVYCHRGQYIGIFPAPTLSITNGLQFLHAPTDSLPTDTDEPKLELSLQYGIVLWAALVAKGESPESDDKDAKELQRILGDIPLDYGSLDLSQPLAFSPDVADARSIGSTPLTTTGNGIFTR